jgi:glycine/D-amino acid oxidase-like deaminating enzyme
MSRIAVIGCGIFGATIALKLQDEGHAVTVFERLPMPLAGASHNNQNRLHLGFHYPRARETAAQCIRGFAAFKAAYPDCVVTGFPNFYFIATEGSLTSPASYLAFCDALGLKYRTIELSRFEPRIAEVALGIITEEVVYDSARLRKRVDQRLIDSGADVQLGTEVTGAKERGGQIVLTLSGGPTDAFDVVVNATYASSSRLAGSLGLPLVERQYEYTVVPIIDTPFGRTGITVMDGPFVSVLPYGASAHHLLYHVEHSVLARSVGHHIDPAWLDQATSPFARLDAEAVFRRMRDAACQFVPAFADARLVGFLHGPRMVLARRDDTDARPSIVDQPRPGYISVFSGKVDHCVSVANEVARRLRAHPEHRHAPPPSPP